MVFETGLSYFTLLCFILAVCIAAVVRGYAGFGFSALVVASVSLLIPVAEIVPIVIMLEVLASLRMLPSAWRHVDWRTFAWIVAGTAIAVPVGLYALSILPVTPTRVIVSLLILGACILIWCGYHLRSPGVGVSFGTGLLAGSMNGIGAIGGLGMMLMFLSARTEAVVARATVILLIMVTDIYAGIVAGFNGLITHHTLSRTLILIIPLVLGVAIGQRRFVRSQPESFRRFTLILLITLASVGLLRALLVSASGS